MRPRFALIKLHLLFTLTVVAYAQDANPVPALITRCKPAVVAIVFGTTTKLPEEAQLPVVGEANTPVDGIAYLYIAGSGFIVSADGYVVTAQHVIKELPEPIQVAVPAGTVLPARVVSTSADHDYAILKLDLKNAPFLEFGSFSDVTEGDDVIYIGHPFGVSQEVTSKGMVSWMGKSEFGNAFQLNAIVNAGNSSGPLIDIKSGHVVGLVKAKYGELSPYLKGIKNGTVGMNVNLGGGGFDLQHFVRDVTNMMDLHIQMGIGYAISTEYVDADLNKAKQNKK